MENKDKNKPDAVKFKFYHIILLIVLFIAVVVFIQIFLNKSGSRSFSVIYRPDTHTIPKLKKTVYRHGWRSVIIPEATKHPASPRLSPASNWVRSPDRRYTAYIDPLEWEVIGDLYVRDNTTKKIINLTDNNRLSQETPKSVVWLNDTLILFISGYPWGTITVGGKLYIYNLRAGKKALIYDPAITKEVAEVSVQSKYIVMRIANFEPTNALYFTLSSRVLRLDSLMADGVIKW
jgi:hypothetical protein